jgi:hypothetical protein
MAIDEKLAEKVMRIEELQAERRDLEESLSLSLKMIAFMPDIFSGECESFSVGFDFSVDGKEYKRNRLRTYDRTQHAWKLYKHSIAVISLKDKDGGVIEERTSPARELPIEFLPPFMHRERERETKRKVKHYGNK